MDNSRRTRARKVSGEVLHVVLLHMRTIRLAAARLESANKETIRDLRRIGQDLDAITHLRNFLESPTHSKRESLTIK